MGSVSSLHAEKTVCWLIVAQFHKVSLIMLNQSIGTDCSRFIGLPSPSTLHLRTQLPGCQQVAFLDFQIELQRFWSQIIHACNSHRWKHTRKIEVF